MAVSGQFQGSFRQFQGKKKGVEINLLQFTKQNFQKNLKKIQQKINLATQNILSHCISSILRL